MQHNVMHPWLAASWEHLAGYIAQQRMPQALILKGGAGNGKQELARYFAKAMCCEGPAASVLPCDSCHGCQLFNAETHPDFLLIEPPAAGKTIGVEMIRQLLGRLSLKPQFLAQRVVLINPADALNPAAANAFLKCLEEPNERTTFLLVTEQMSKLPATVISRCQIVDTGRVSSDAALAWLQAQHIEHSAMLLRIAQGDPLLAKHYADRGMALIYHEYLHEWLELADGEASPVQLAETWHKRDVAAPAVVLTWVLQWLTMMVKRAFQQQSLTENEKGLQDLSERLELKKVFRFYDLVLQALPLLDTTLNKQMLIEQILIEWSRLTRE